MYIDNIYSGNDEITTKETADGVELSIHNETGSGLMTVYNILDGVFVSYNDFHLSHCESRFDASISTLNIEHCREGRIEWDNGDGSFTYIEAGDMMISCNKVKNKESKFCFPISHYHGVTISFDVEKTGSTLPQLLGGFSADIKGIMERFCVDGGCFVMRADRQIEHIFSELYILPQKIRIDYCKIKMLELLLFLEAAELPVELSTRKYFGKANVEKIKQINALITKNLQDKYTVAELSKRFHFPLTSMKNCFKAVYGQSVYAYTKSYKMNAAAVMLKNRSNSILEIAGKVGYDNAGKFSAAFKDVMGVTPSEYRKNVRMD